MEFLILLLGFLLSGAAASQRPALRNHPATQLSGAEIMRRVNARSRGQGSEMEMAMTMHDLKRGGFRKKIVVRRTRVSSRYRTSYWISAPDHEKGIGLLISEDRAQQGMWMYFPETRSVVHVVSRGFPALASDFSCEDLLVRVPLEDYEFRVLGRELVDGVWTSKVQMTPITERLRSELGFSRAVGWVRDDIWLIVRADYEDENGVVFKSFRAQRVEKVQGVWTVRSLSMENERIHHRTDIEIEEIRYSAPLSQHRFVPQLLGRMP